MFHADLKGCNSSTGLYDEVFRITCIMITQSYVKVEFDIFSVFLLNINGVRQTYNVLTMLYCDIGYQLVNHYIF